MIELPLMDHKNQLRLKTQDGKRYLFGSIRKKWLVLQPEEMIRQLLFHFLVEKLGYNKNRISVERGLKVNTLDKRFDLLVYDQTMQPFLLAECKAPHVKIDQEVFKQISWYNMPLKVPYLLVTNGIKTYCCSIDYEKQDYSFLNKIPGFPESENPQPLDLEDVPKDE